MSEIIFNGALGITVPGGFEIISERELTGAGDRPGTSWGARDPQRHILVTVNAKKVPFLLGALAAMPKVRDNSLREVMKKVPGCRPGENFEISVAGSTAYGFRYDYTVRDVPQTGMY
ncbi:MAG: hypothetical protein CW338_00230, partial [Clostridiales bacterium]|nr:hypothetical protein [Clostridiales bacterium]